MKLLVLIISVFCSAQALAMTSSEMREKGCIPFRRDDGSITMKCKLQQNTQQDGRQLQLQAGDVISEFNGEPVDSPAKAMELYNSMKENSVNTMTVERQDADISDILSAERKRHNESIDSN